MTRAATMHQAVETQSAFTYIQRPQQSCVGQARPLVLALRARTASVARMQIVAFLDIASTAVVSAEHPCMSKMPISRGQYYM